MDLPSAAHHNIDCRPVLVKFIICQTAGESFHSSRCPVAGRPFFRARVPILPRRHPPLAYLIVIASFFSVSLSHVSQSWHLKVRPQAGRWKTASVNLRVHPWTIFFRCRNVLISLLEAKPDEDQAKASFTDGASETLNGSKLQEPEYDVEVKLSDLQADPNNPLYSVKSFDELGLYVPLGRLVCSRDSILTPR